MGEGGTLPLVRQRVPAHGAAVLEAGGGEVGRGQSEANNAAGDQSEASIAAGDQSEASITAGDQSEASIAAGDQSGASITWRQVEVK